MSIVLDGLELPNDLFWADEFDWSPLSQKESRSITGALIIESGVMTGGRPITLAGSDTSAWIARSALQQLYGLLANNAEMVLQLNGVSRNVRFNHGQTPIKAQPVVDYAAPAADDHYTITIRLIEV